jgi:hypothetical protein
MKVKSRSEFLVGSVNTHYWVRIDPAVIRQGKERFFLLIVLIIINQKRLGDREGKRSARLDEKSPP